MRFVLMDVIYISHGVVSELCMQDISDWYCKGAYADELHWQDKTMTRSQFLMFRVDVQLC
jgi:hypothetical protein